MLSRDELYRLVWSEPMIRIAERSGVSGSYLARICTLLNVPRPERGYWAKLEVGKAPPKKPLPEARPGDPLQWSKEGEPVARPNPKAPAPRSIKRKVRISRTGIHGLVSGARHHFEHGRDVEEGAYLKPYKKLLVDVTASQAGLEKALGLANELFNALHSVGHRVVLAASDTDFRRAHIDEREKPGKIRDAWQYRGLWSPWRPTIVYVGTVAIGLAVLEMSEEVLLRYAKGKYVRESEYQPPRNRYQNDYTWTTTRELPSGRMRIVSYSPYGSVNWSKHWQETKTASLRSQMRTIVSAIEAASPEIVEKLEEAAREVEIRHQQWLVEEDRRQREQDRRRVEQSIAESKMELRHVIERWSDVTTIERFFATAEERAQGCVEADRNLVLQRLALGRQFVGSQNPLDFFCDWKTPDERYTPKYPNE